MPIFSTDYLNRLVLEAEEDIATRIPCIIERYSLAVTASTNEYQLPDYIQNIRKIFWKGIRLDAISHLEEPVLYNTGVNTNVFSGGGFHTPAFNSSAFNIGTPTIVTTQVYGGKPHSYFYSKLGENKIRFEPGVPETVAQLTTGLYSTNIGNTVIIEYYRQPDGSTYKIPTYIRRRTIKAYVLWKAFAKEGPGQNLTASEYWNNRYALAIIKAKRIIDNVYISTVRARQAPSKITNNLKPARPVLPWNWGVKAEDDNY